LPKPSPIKHLEEVDVAAENAKETIAVELTAQETRPTQPLVKRTDSGPQSQAEAGTDEYEQPVAVETESNIYSADGSLLAVEMPRAELSAQQQRHQERLERVERDLKPTYSKEQLERMQKQILVNLPKSYQDMFKNFEHMKQAEVEKRRFARSQPRQISGAAYYSDKGAKGEKPRFSNTEDYKDKDN
jgi:hypothetical protein